MIIRKYLPMQNIWLRLPSSASVSLWYSCKHTNRSSFTFSFLFNTPILAWNIEGRINIQTTQKSLFQNEQFLHYLGLSVLAWAGNIIKSNLTACGWRTWNCMLSFFKKLIQSITCLVNFFNALFMVSQLIPQRLHCRLPS